jgi:hypothetical protein
MIGLNGGLIGARRSTSILSSNAGVWSPLEQLKNCRNGLWPGRVVTNNLVLYIDSASTACYPGSGTAITDLSGNSNNLTGTSTLRFNYENLGSFFFDGSTSWATAASNAFLPNNLFADNGGSWTVSCWFKFPAVPFGTKSGNQCWMIVGRGGGIGGAATFGIFVGSETDTTYGNYAPFKLASVIRGAVTVISSGSVNTDTWNYVALTWDGSSGSIYFNDASAINMNVGTATLQATSAFAVGSGAGTPSASFAYSGNIAQVAVYSSALSAADVGHNYKALRGRFVS